MSEGSGGGMGHRQIEEAVSRPGGQGSPRVVREPRLVGRVVFVGGHPGCGKSMMAQIVGSLARVEMQKYNYTIEHLCALSLLGRLDSDVASVMIRMLTDLDLYNLTMAREVNFRFSDLSSALNNPGGWRYVGRLFLPGDAVAVERIRQQQPVLHITTHYALALSPALFTALGDAVRILEVVRHPLYMIKQWHLYIERYGTDVRDFTVWFEYEGRSLPFFAWGWEEQYLRANAMDRVIYSIERLSQLGADALRACPRQEHVMVVPFERFVRDPWPSLEALELFLGTQVTPRTRRELKRQRVPRVRIADGIERKVYRVNGWEPPRRGLSEAEELQRRRQFAAEHASPKGLEVLDRLCREYEARYLSDLDDA